MFDYNDYVLMIVGLPRGSINYFEIIMTNFVFAGQGRN